MNYTAKKGADPDHSMTESMDFADADRTPNPERAIYLEGKLTEGLLDRLEPQIRALTSANREPITVFIDSPGGSAFVGERILGLLRSTTEDDTSASRIITVAVSRAGSAAADLLSAGDFAIASPGSTLYYHGTRTPMPEGPVTGEWATLLGEALTTSNERYATQLARKSAQRFPFILSALRAEFQEYRAEVNDSSLSELQCFQSVLLRKLSPDAQRVLEKAFARWDDYNGLLRHFRKRITRDRGPNKADLQDVMLSASIALERQRKTRNPTSHLRSGGLGRIRDHFYFLDAYFRNVHDVELWTPGASAKAAEDAAAPLAEPREAASYFLPFRTFAFALCRALQDGDNRLTAMDALYLGLIDTVR